jgi:putative tryptophan/tyrosine transport system substrate-binding protein
LVARPLAVSAQEAGRTHRLGIVAPLPCEAPWDAAFYGELGRRRFIRGQNLAVDCRDFGRNIELSSQYAAELVKAKVDVIIAYGDEAIRAAQQATKTIPIVGVSQTTWSDRDW